MRQSTQYALIVVSIVGLSCDALFDTDEDELDTSKQYLTASVNDLVWQADRNYINCYHPQGGDYSRFWLGAAVHEQGGISKHLSFSISGFDGVGTYRLSTTNRGSYYHSEYAHSREFITSDTDTGFVTITNLDWTTKLVSGQFEFVARERTNDSVLTILAGTFQAVCTTDR